MSFTFYFVLQTEEKSKEWITTVNGFPDSGNCFSEAWPTLKTIAASLKKATYNCLEKGNITCVQGEIETLCIEPMSAAIKKLGESKKRSDIDQRGLLINLRYGDQTVIKEMEDVRGKKDGPELIDELFLKSETNVKNQIKVLNDFECM